MPIYVHSVPGRLRVKIPEIRHRHDLCEAVRHQLEDRQGVQDVSVNPLTGSVKIQYDPAVLESGHLLHLLESNGFYDPSRAEDAQSRFLASTQRSSDALGRYLVSWALGKALESSGLGMLAVLI